MKYSYGHFPPSTDSRRAVVSYKRNYVHEALVNSLVKLAQEKVWLGEKTVYRLRRKELNQNQKPFIYISSLKSSQLYFT